MKLRLKTFLAIVITFFLAIAVGHIYTNTVFIKGFINLEHQEIEANVNQFHYALDHEIEDLGILTNDWAAWDDSYTFIQNANQNFIDSNLVDDTYYELGLDFIIYMDNDGNPVYQKAFDLENEVETEIENSTFQYLTEQIFSSPKTSSNDSIQGIFLENSQPIIFAARPILPSLNNGPQKGILIFGKSLSGKLFEHLSSTIVSELTIFPFSPEKFNIYPLSPINPEIQVDTSSLESIRFFSLIRDREGSPLLIVEQSLPRNIYRQGLEGKRDFLISLVISGILASIVALIALEFGFLRRFSKLTNGVESFNVLNLKEHEMVLKGKDEIAGLSKDIHNALTKLAAAQKGLTAHLDFEKLLVSISTKFINLPIDQIDEGFNRLLKVIGEFSNIDRSYILLSRESNPYILDITHEWHGAGLKSIKSTGSAIKVNPSGWWMNSLRKGNPIIFNDANHIPLEAKIEEDLFLKQPVQSFAAVPIVISGKLIGLLGFVSCQDKKGWSEQTITFMEVISTVIASAIGRSRHEIKILHSQQYLTNLKEISERSIRQSTLKASCRVISKKLSDLISSENSYLVILNKDAICEVYNSGRKMALDKNKISIFQKISDKTGLHACQLDSEAILDLKINTKNYEFSGKSILSVPLIEKNSKIGLVVFSNDQGHVYSDEEMLFSQQSAFQITLSLLKTIALQTAQRRSDELNTLRATLADIASELELKKLLNTLLERAIRLVGADGGDFCMVDEKNAILEVVTSINMDKSYNGTVIQFNEGASGKAFSTQKAVIVKDYSTWPQRLEIINESNLRATIVFPLLLGNKVLGTLGIFHFSPDKQFSKDDQHLLSLFAQQASIAMENAILFEKVQQMARIDELTGFYNRRAFKNVGEYEINRAIRHNHAITLAMIDLDKFKRINDQFSHQTGDDVLREFARICKENIRNVDIICRYGGDEAAILMPETDIDNAIIVMERLRLLTEMTPIIVGKETFHITVSIGLASFKKDPPPLDQMMNNADSSLYQAKHDGRNCVRIFNPIEK